MSKGKELRKELQVEAAITRNYLKRVPFDQSEYQPTEKSEKLGRLAIHVAEIIAWWSQMIHHEKMDFINFEPEEIANTEELLSYFDKLLDKSLSSLEEVKDEEFEKEWSMTYGDQILFTLLKLKVARTFCMNHLIHHRAQLSVYLRLLDIPIPAVYGPSADDEDVVIVDLLK